MRKPRPGAQGICKVKSGCQTCKIRHKKCDETRPFCSPCSSTGRCCDFASSSQVQETRAATRIPSSELQGALYPLWSNRPVHSSRPSTLEAHLFAFFRSICAREISLYFSNALWESLILRTAYVEPSIYHASLAIGALKRVNYSASGRGMPAAEYALVRYDLAIRCLNARLDGSVQSAWLAVLASVVFIEIESLRGWFGRTSMHLRGGLGVVRELEDGGGDVGVLKEALYQLRDEVVALEGMGGRSVELVCEP